MRNLVLVLGDQLDLQSSAWEGIDRQQDAVWMAEVHEEAAHFWCHQLRIATFFSCMRHFRDDLRRQGYTVHYTELPERQSDDRGSDLASVLRQDVHQYRPKKLIVVQPGDWRVAESLKKEAAHLDIELEVRPDRHFYCSVEQFKKWASGRKSLVLESFYRQMRRQEGILIEEDGEPTGGQWNFDHDNRQTFGRDGPQDVPPPQSFPPDEVSQDVLRLVQRRFAEHPGRLDYFLLPVDRSGAVAFLEDFIEHRLKGFGPFEDAMWTDEAILFHSRLSVLLNLKLLNPRECVDKAIEAYRNNQAPLNSVEGFVRQLLGWREYVRGIYWLNMPGYAELNHLGQTQDVPSFFWDGQTEMECIRQSMQHVLNHGYAHHIHRLMVLGNFAQIFGVDPRKFHQWHMAMYLDAVDWVSLPNALGMSQYGDGGIMATKPYCASGNYTNKMSNFCSNCRYNYRRAHGENACPVTTLYWDFLDRHDQTFQNNPRMNLQMANLQKKRQQGEIERIRKQAETIRTGG